MSDQSWAAEAVVAGAALLLLIAFLVPCAVGVRRERKAAEREVHAGQAEAGRS